MAKPAQIPTYATDPTLTGGPQVGLSTRLAPSGGTLAQGFYTDARLPARAFAWLIGLIGDWIGYLSKIQVLNWTLAAWDFFPTTTLNSRVCWIPKPTVGTGFWMVYGNTSTPTIRSGSLPYMLPGTGQVAALVAAPGLTVWTHTVVGGSTIVAAGSDASGNTVVYTSTDHGNTWTSRTVVAGSSYGCAGLTYDATHGKFIYVPIVTFGTLTSLIFTSSDGITWTHSTDPVGNIPGANANIYWDSANGETALIMNNSMSVSTDGGLTWDTFAVVPFTLFGTVAFQRAAYTTQFGWRVLGTTQLGSTPTLASRVWSFGSSAFAGTGVAIASDGVGRYVIANYDPTTAIPGSGVWILDNGTDITFNCFNSQITTDFLPWSLAYNGSQWAVLGKPNTATAHYSVWLSAAL